MTMTNDTEDDGDCARCDGSGGIDGAIESLRCPLCEDVCHWCNNPSGDMEPIGETGFSVCRNCIRHMSFYKECVPFQFHLTNGVEEHVNTPGALRDAISNSIESVFDEFGININASEWDIVGESDE